MHSQRPELASVHAHGKLACMLMQTCINPGNVAKSWKADSIKKDSPGQIGQNTMLTPQCLTHLARNNAKMWYIQYIWPKLRVGGQIWDLFTSVLMAWLASMHAYG